MIINKAYRFRCYPSKIQELRMNEYGEVARLVWNWGVRISQETRRYGFYETYNDDPEKRVRHETLNEEGQPVRINWAALSKLFTSLINIERNKELKAKYPRLMMEQVLGDLKKSYIAWGKGIAQIPKEHKDGCSFRESYQRSDPIQGNRAYITKIGWVRFKKDCEVLGTIKSATFTKEPTGKWYVSLTVSQEVSDVIKADIDEQVVGIDLGLMFFATLDDGQRVEALRFYQEDEEKLARLQREFALKKKGSNSYKKKRLEIARLYEKQRHRRANILHNLSHTITRDNNVIVMEGFNIQEMIADGHRQRAKTIHDQGWGEFRRQVKYKADWRGKNYIEADQYFPSSKTCSCCGTIQLKMPLDIREWACSACGTIHDRDQNAALNLRQLAVA